MGKKTNLVATKQNAILKMSQQQNQRGKSENISRQDKSSSKMDAHSNTGLPWDMKKTQQKSKLPPKRISRRTNKTQSQQRKELRSERK